jgi:heat shock protein HtpX
MKFVKRIFLFLFLNFLVCTAISLVLILFNVQPVLTHYGLNIVSLSIMCLLWGMAGALISLALSRKMAKWIMGVQLINPNTSDSQEREVYGMVASLAREAGLPMPQVGIFRSNEANAFATGPTRKRSLVAVSSGLLQRMNPSQVRGVLGHELAHIANGDMVTMTLLQGVVNAFVMFLSRVLAYALSGLGRNRNSNSSSNSGLGSFYLFTMLFQTVFMIFGSLLVAAFSRWREFRADAGGARLAGKESMISALRALENMHDIRDVKMQEKAAFTAFGISSRRRSWLSVFATHPPIEKRIERLERS